MRSKMIVLKNADYIQDYDTGYVYGIDGKRINTILNTDNTQPVADVTTNKYSGISIGDDIYYATTQQQNNAIHYYSYRVAKIRATSKYRGLLHGKKYQQLYRDIESMYMEVCTKRDQQRQHEFTTNKRYNTFEKMLIEYKLDVINEYRYKITKLINYYHDALCNYNCAKIKMDCIKKIYTPKNDYNSVISYKRNLYYEKKYLQDYKMVLYKHKFILQNEMQNAYMVIKNIMDNLTTYKCM